uniref:Uncharacterized protein n=1 Tax=Podarcis muralis TaxID=64176 RepID=A0A670I0F0_PODMU
RMLQPSPKISGHILPLKDLHWPPVRSVALTPRIPCYPSALCVWPFCYTICSLSSLLPVFFSSLTSLQAEEFFDMVAKFQARRLDDQRADFEEAAEMCAGNSRVSEEKLYDTILAHQSQRLEDQRTEPPIPVGIQGLLDLLLKAQGTRMEDQRMCDATNSCPKGGRTSG